MPDYGITLDESRLLISVILSGVTVLVFLGLLIVWILFSRRMISVENEKDTARIRKLRGLADTDEAARKELEKRLRRAAREKDKRIPVRLENGVVSLLLAAVALACLFFYTVPTWQDYFVKDYKVYTGSYTVTYYKRTHWIELEDGTTLRYGSAPEGEYTGKVVYASRSRIVVGRGEQ